MALKVVTNLFLYFSLLSLALSNSTQLSVKFTANVNYLRPTCATSKAAEMYEDFKVGFYFCICHKRRLIDLLKDIEKFRCVCNVSRRA